MRVSYVQKIFNTICSPHEVLREIPIDCLLHHGRPGKSTGEGKGENGSEDCGGVLSYLLGALTFSACCANECRIGVAVDVEEVCRRIIFSRR